MPREILILNGDHLMGTHLLQALNEKGFSIRRTTETKIRNNIPVIFFNAEHENSLMRMMSFLRKYNLKPNPLFILTTQTMVTHSTKLDHLGAIVEIRMEHEEIDLLNNCEKMEYPDGRKKLKGHKNIIDKLTDLINEYVLHPPNEDAYIIENVKPQEEKTTIGVVGLGYVGLPVAITLAEKYDVIGFDIDQKKIKLLKKNIDPTGEVLQKELEKVSIEFTTDESRLKNCKYIIIIVPTPLTSTKEPDLSYLKNASKTVGQNLSKGTIVIYESTVYPGTTEDICIPILEEHSHLKSGEDFYVGYSPERINPGDQKHIFKKTSKVVAGENSIALEKIYKLYDRVLEAEVYQSPSIKVAEAAKIVENVQRDINIALMNELAMIFDYLEIDTTEVLKAAQTKWNFMPFKPGLVGGHCIGVDPYYLIHQSEQSGYHPTFISKARSINEHMPDYIVQKLLELVIKHRLNKKDLKVTVLGITYKENISDIRNSKSLEIIKKLQSLGISVQVCDPMLSADTFITEEFDFKEFHQLDKADVVILAVPSKKYSYTKQNFFAELLDHNKGIVMDVKGVIPSGTLHKDIVHWKL